MRKVRKKISLFAVLGVLLYSHCFAEENKTTYLNTVVVSAAKKEATLLETPGTVNIITAEDIEKSGQRTLAGIITSIPGVMDDGSGSSSYVSFRGTRSSASEGAVIYLDGRPLNFGRYDYSSIDDIPVENIERIEIIKAPSASLYGANSARGVINIITKTGKSTKKPLEVSATQGFGVWDTYKTFASAKGNKNQWDYSLSYTREDSGGYRHTDPELNTVNTQFGYEFADKIRADLYFTWDNTWRKTGTALKSWALEDRRQNDPPISLTNSIRVRPNEQDHNLLSEGIVFRYDRDNWLLKTSFDYNHFDDVYSSLKYYNVSGNTTTSRGGCYKDDRDQNKADFKIAGGRTFTDNDKFLDTLILGYDYAGEDWKQERSYPYASSLTPFLTTIKKNNIKYTRDINGVFANNELKYAKWGLTGGLRYDLVDYDVKNEVPDSVKKKFKELSWDIAPSYSITPESNVYFSRSRNFWYPNAYYFTAAMDYDYAENKPEDLKPEIYNNYEIGFKHRLAKYLNYNIAFFRTYIDNKYMPCYDDSGAFKGYKHVGNSIHQGIELGADGRPLDWFGYRLGFTWLNAKWDSAKTAVYVNPTDTKTQVTDISGKKLYRVPDYQYLVGFDFNPLKKLTFSLDIHGYGEQWIDALNRIKNGAVTLVDMKAKYALTKNFEMYIAGSNIFDFEYESIFNSSGKYAKGIPDNDYYPKDGRYFEIGGTVKF